MRVWDDYIPTRVLFKSTLIRVWWGERRVYKLYSFLLYSPCTVIALANNLRRTLLLRLIWLPKHTSSNDHKRRLSFSIIKIFIKGEWKCEIVSGRESESEHKLHIKLLKHLLFILSHSPLLIYNLNNMIIWKYKNSLRVYPSFRPYLSFQFIT